MHRTALLAIPLALLLAGLLSGCGDDGGTVPVAGTDEVMPLAVGNTWQYAWRANEPGAPIVTLTRTVTEQRRIRVGDRDVTVAVEMPLEPLGKSIQPDVGRLLRNEADGLYLYGWVYPDETVVFSEPRLVAPRHGTVGASLDQGGGTALVCVAVDAAVTTDFGTVQADVYELWMDEGTIRVPDIYVVPGVGLTRYYNRQWTLWMTGYEFD